MDDTRLSWATAAACFGGGLALGMLVNKGSKASSASTNAVGAPCKLRAMGFCGIDDTVDPRLLLAVSRAYPWVEWGVLFRDDLAGTPRYASTKALADLKVVNDAAGRPMRLAAHLCGPYCEAVLQGPDAAVPTLRRLATQYGFKRVQVNATEANSVTLLAAAVATGNKAGEVDAVVERVRAVIRALPELEFIIQCNDETAPMWERIAACSLTDHPNISFLFDGSMGRGVVAAQWPSPDGAKGKPFGYAGGLGPATIEAQLERMAVAAGGPGSQQFWIDMESGIRTGTSSTSAKPGAIVDRDVFDVSKCMDCIRTAVRMGIMTDQ